MALAANRVEIQVLELSQLPDTWGQGVGEPYIEQHFYDHPYPKVTILVKEVRQWSDQAGHVISRQVDTWEYDEVTRAARSHLTEIWAWVYLPGVSERGDLIKVEEDATTYTTEGWLIGGPVSYLKTKSGYVVYDLKPETVPLTAGQLAQVQAKGVDPTPHRYSEETEQRIIPDSGRVWQPAIAGASIVEKPTAPQIALWRDPFEVEEQHVVEDFQKIVRTTVRKNFLEPGPPTFERSEQLKDPMSIDLPLDLAPPAIKAVSAGTQGVRIEIKGGGVDLGSIEAGWGGFIQHVRPETYAVYRKTLAQPDREPAGDTFGIYEAGPAYQDQGIGRPVEDSEVTDYEGAPASPLPAQGSYTEPEDPTPPPADDWTRIGEPENDETDKRLEGHALFFDTEVENGGEYDYFAVAVVAGKESPESNHETVDYLGGLVFSSSIRVNVIEKRDGALEIDVQGPPLPGVLDNYGEVQTHVVPAALSVEPEAGWQDGALILDAARLGREIGLRKLTHEGEQENVRVPLTEILLNLERGQAVRIPQLMWDVYANSLHLSSRTLPERFMVEGFRFSVSRRGPELAVDAGSLELELP
jgi:hypothetical protein